ncbi:MAG TPA: penicillin-insensitive murein endopeptidase [Pyrinomonadaceae bacterium]|nr:penicillin-insensitive murein endopeptidase [Pyrinomonadaceae bacterium]
MSETNGGDSGLAAATFTGTDDSTVSTDARIVLVNVIGIENVTQDFKDKVMQVAERLGMNPNYLMAVMSFETGGKFSPGVKSLSGSGATGLIQFMPATAKALGTTTAALAQMTAEEQLDYVEKYLRPYRNRMKTVEDAYMAVLYPAAIGKGADHVLFRKGTKVYQQNAGLDINRDGVITVGEAAAKVRARLGAAPVSTGEVLRRGVKGPEVGKLQDELIDLGYLRPEQKASGPNSFGPLTEGALKRFQRDNQLGETGVYDEATQQAVRQLNEGVRRGGEGDVVTGLQLRLVNLSYLTLADLGGGRGKFGPRTEAALKTFQMQHGLQPSGALNDATYRALLSSSPTPPAPVASPDPTRIDTVLPESGRGYTTYNREPNGADQYGRAATIRNIQTLGEEWAVLHPAGPRLQFGDISRRGGGPFPPHSAHKNGNEVDIRPLTNNGREEATNIHSPSYSHELTKELAQLVRRLFPTARVFFNDKQLIKAGLTAPLGGHDNHLHVGFRG